MKWISLLFLLAAISMSPGCSGARAGSHSAAMDANRFPFVLRGDDTLIRFDFSAGDAGFRPPHELLEDEVCCLVVGSSTIECFADGSALILGPDDGISLVDSNPLWQLRPAVQDKEATRLMKLYATLFLIAGSVEKLPSALTDYLDDPGPRRAVVIAIIRKLAIDGGGEFAAAAHGGNFVVSFRLTDAGRDKLLEALQSLQEENGLQFVDVTGAASPLPAVQR